MLPVLERPGFLAMQPQQAAPAAPAFRAEPAPETPEAEAHYSPEATGAATPTTPEFLQQETATAGIYDDDDVDSAYGDDSGPSTASLSSTIHEYRVLHGRTYHNANRGDYWAVNDAKSLEVSDILHASYTLQLDGQLHMAPLGDDCYRALDVGTGTGIWAIDFADDYPACEVIGTDISPNLQPMFVPTNCRL